MPPEFENIVMKMLAKDPNDRFERLEDAAAELNHFAHLQDKKAGSKQVANFLKEIFDNTLDERAKELLSDAGKFMKTPSQGTSSFKMAQRSSTGAAASSTGSKSSTDATQVYQGQDQSVSQTIRRTRPKKASSLTLVLAGALGATVLLAILLGVGFFVYQAGQNSAQAPAATPAAPTTAPNTAPSQTP